MTSLSRREQRLIAFFILLLIISGGWLLIVAPILDGFAARHDQRIELSATIERNQRLIAALPQLRRRVERQRPDEARFSLAAPTREAAADLLRQRLQQSFEQSGGALVSLGDTTPGGRWVGASVEGTVTLDQLVRLLADVQNQPPYLVVTGLTVVADRAFQSQKLDVMNVKTDVAIHTH